MSTRSLLAPLAAAVLLAACADSADDLLAPDLPPVQAAVSGGDEASTAGFYFLPPLVDAPRYDGTFDGSLLPYLHVDVCRVQEAACEPVVSFSAEGPGSERIRRSDKDEHYIVNWSTRDHEPGLYRIEVRAMAVPLGAIELQVGEDRRGLRRGPGEAVGGAARSTVPVKFRVEEGAIVVLGSDGAIIDALGGQVTLDVPEGALPEPLAIAIRPTDPEDPEARLGFELLPWDAGFLEPVTLTVRGEPLPIPDDLEATTEYVLEHDDADGAWHEVPSVYDFETGAVSISLVTFALDPVDPPELPALPADDPEGDTEDEPATAFEQRETRDDAGDGAAEGDDTASTAAKPVSPEVAGFFNLPVPRIPRIVPPRFRVPAPRPTRTRSCVLALQVRPGLVPVHVAGSSPVRLQAGRLSRGGFLGLPMLSWYDVAPGAATWTDESALIDVAPGVVTGIEAGRASYRVTYPASPSSYCVPSSTIGGAQVAYPPTASITIEPTEASLDVDETVALAVTLTSILDTDVTGHRPVTYASDDEEVATVDAAGVVTAVAAGTATITATSDGVSASVVVMVVGSEAPVASVAISPDGGTMDIGQTLVLTAELTSADGETLTRDVAWSAEPAAGVSLVARGAAVDVTGQAEGSYTVTAESEGVSAAVTVVVMAPPPPPTPGSATFFDGDFAHGDWTWQLVTHANGGTATITHETVGGHPDAYMRVSHHVAAGSAPPNDSHVFTFHARAGAVHDPAVDGEITSLDYSESSILFECEFTGCHGQATGPALMQDGHIYQFRTGNIPYSVFLNTWRQQTSSGLTAGHFGLVMDASQPGVLHVDGTRHPDFSPTGSPIQFGFHRWGSHTNSLTPTRTAGIDNWSITLHTLVPVAEVDRVTVEPASATLEVGTTRAFTARAFDAAGTELSHGPATWSSDDEGVATIDGDGLATAVAPGTTTLRATVDGVTGTATVTVNPPPGGAVVARGGRDLGIVVGPDDTVYFMQCASSDIAVFTSADGAAWTERGRLAESCSNRPMLRIDDAGTLYFTPNGQTWVRRSTDGGATWGPRESMPRASTHLNGLWATPDGDVFTVGTLAGTFPNTQLYVFRSTAGGPFEELTLLPSLGQAEFPTVAVNAGSGTIHVAWRQGSCASCRVQHTRSTDGGASWSAPNTVSGFSAEAPALTAGPFGDVLIAWRDGATGEPLHMAASSSTDGATFGPPFTIEHGVHSYGRSIASAGRTFWAVTRYLPFLPHADLWLSKAPFGAGSFRGSDRITSTSDELESVFDVAASPTRVCVGYVESSSAAMRVICRAP